MTPPELMFWSTLVWLLLLGWLSCTNAELPTGTTSGLARWLFVKCWYKLPWLLAGSDEEVTDMFAGLAACSWAWFVTIVDTVELLLVFILLLLLLFVGIWIPGTVVADERGTDTTRLSPCCCRSSFILFTLFDDDFTWIFCVITCDFTVDDAGGDEMCGVAFVEAIVAEELDECITTFGLTFWMFGSCCWVLLAAAVTEGVAWEFKSVRA